MSVITHTRQADSAYVLIYGGNVTSGSLIETYAPTLADAVAEHDDLITAYYRAGSPNHFDVRVQALSVLDAVDNGDDVADADVFHTCRRCTSAETDQYSIGNDYKGYYCDGCARALMFPVWYAPAGKPMQPSKSREGVRRLAADTGWQRDPLAAQSLVDDVYVRDGARVYVSHDSDTGRFIVGQLFDGYAPGSDALTDGGVADVRAWLKAADDVIPSAVSDLADAVGMATGISYVASNVLSAGDYASEYVFDGLPDDDSARKAYAALRARLTDTGTRYAVISRTVAHDTGESAELSVIVAPTPVWLADVLRFTGAVADGDVRVGARRYYSEPCEYYTVNGALTETYCVDIVGMSGARLAVIESAAGIGK